MKVLTIKKAQGVDVYKSETLEFLGNFVVTSYGENGKSTGCRKNNK